ncbi:MAG: hypothetical protein JNM80_07405 [Phycisphaerae bacterium]|nr:hypothetical protein [Phycisphaerae bacterium]
MPANRSRTQRWHESLDQILERQGALELSFPASDPGAGDVIWRVRLLSVTDQEIGVEQPNAAGHALDFGPGLECIVGMSIGQNRWMFRTRTLGSTGGPGLATRALRLALPQTVERCQRRNFYRVSTASVTPVTADCWPILDPTTVRAAEVANRAHILDLIERGGCAKPGDEPLVLPEVGPKLTATLLNLGGGGAGLLFTRHDSGSIERSRLFWLRLNLTPHVPAPLAVTARMAHTHLDSTQQLYGGMAFEWSFHPAHREFVVEQVRRYARALQSAQAARKTA